MVPENDRGLIRCVPDARRNNVLSRPMVNASADQAQGNTTDAALCQAYYMVLMLCNVSGQ